MAVSAADVAALMLEFCPGKSSLTQTQAQEIFHLPHSRLALLPHEDLPNPCGIPGAAPMHLFESSDVARLALEVHGGTCTLLAKAQDTLRDLAEAAKERERRRAEVKDEMEKKSKERAAALVATSPAQKLCKKLGVDPSSEMPKTKAMQCFGLEVRHLHGLKCRTKSNPINSRFSPMKLYRNDELAQRALSCGAKRLDFNA